MQQQNYQELTPQEVANLPIDQLRQFWSDAWKIKSHVHISRKMLINSLLYKIRETSGYGLSHDQQEKLNQFFRAYKRSRDEGAKRQNDIKCGTQLNREWKGKRYNVTVKNGLFEYNEKTYTSLSAIASEITGTRWNGWVFFGVKKPSSNKAAA